MTQAACFKCGEIKHGAFTTCKHCQERPINEADLMVSLALSDHYLAPKELLDISSEIKGGKTFELTQDQILVLSDEVKNFIKSPLGAALIGQRKEPPTKKWWQFWI